MAAKSIKPQPMIIPGKYVGIWSAYFVQIIFHNGNKSEPIELNEGIRGVNFKCKVEVKEDGYVYVE